MKALTSEGKDNAANKENAVTTTRRHYGDTMVVFFAPPEHNPLSGKHEDTRRPPNVHAYSHTDLPHVAYACTTQSYNARPDPSLEGEGKDEMGVGL